MTDIINNDGVVAEVTAAPEAEEATEVVATEGGENEGTTVAEDAEGTEAQATEEDAPVAEDEVTA
jgi:hypothetical protein